MELYSLVTFVQLLNYSNEFKENKTSYLSYLVHDSLFGKQPKSKGPDGYSVSRKSLAGGIAIDSWGLEIFIPRNKREGPEMVD